MSRTVRTHVDGRYHHNGNYYRWQDLPPYPWRFTSGWQYEHYVDRKARDRKPWNKPPKWFKQMNRRIERARVKNAMRNDREIPHFRKSDQWEWT